MIDFAAIAASAAARAGGAQALEDRLPVPKTEAELRAVADDRYLSLMSLRIFRAGLKHGLVDDRWPAFEGAFSGFVPERVVAMSDEALERLMGDRRLIRHWGKIRSVRDNAAAMLGVVREKGSFGGHLAAWPAADVTGLWDDLARRFSQFGGNSAATFLRMAGKDTFILTDAVVRALAHWGVADGRPRGKAARGQVQSHFNAWSAATGRPLCQLSMMLALSVD